ncbi:MAG TPA: GLUG motif-containing protein [Rhizomicrobium sp.]|jgi:hypothetical protein|nr:GLUG motif-containing protein [Rhizomicrobium sp.]
MKSETLIGLTAALLLSSAAARADVEISAKATSNMSCDAGVCTATAQKAVLNVSDLATMLASGDVAVKTGLVAKDIGIDQPLQWTNTSRLTLDAQQSVTVKKQITVAGTGALTVITNDSGGAKGKSKTGEFIIVPERGSVQFWDLGSSLIIDGNSYTLVGDIKTLASDIAANPSGFYALAKPYDASVDGAYTTAPVATTFGGTFDGLGNSISNFSMRHSDGGLYAFFAWIAQPGVVRDVRLSKVDLVIEDGGDDLGDVATLVLINEGALLRSSASGSIKLPLNGGINTGGLVAESLGLVRNSYAHIGISIEHANYVGGLVGASSGKVERSYADGTIRARYSAANFGGLVGYNIGAISNSYSLTNMTVGKQNLNGSFGGMIGTNNSGATVVSSYVGGTFQQKKPNNSVFAGGVVGSDNAPGSFSDTYWDLDKGISDPSQGAGNVPNDPGIVGLTDVQLKAGLPSGFDPRVWAIGPNTNGGFPYLVDIPPRD